MFFDTPLYIQNEYQTKKGNKHIILLLIILQRSAGTGRIRSEGSGGQDPGVRVGEVEQQAVPGRLPRIAGGRHRVCQERARFEG